MIDAYLPYVLENHAKPYQRVWFRDCMSGRFTGLLGARQIGKSWTLGLVALALANGGTFWGSKVRGHDVKIVSKDLETAKTIIAAIRKHLFLIEKAYGVRVDHKNLGGVKDVYLTNGSKITAMPGTPRTLQGFSGSVIVDEVSANKWDPELLFAQALSVTSDPRGHGYKIILASNADVEGSWTHRFWRDPAWADRRASFKLHTTTIFDAWPGGLPEGLRMRQRAMSAISWSRFYLCEFPGVGSGVVDRDQLLIMPVLPLTSGTVVMGVDPGFAENGNPTGVCVVELGSGKNPHKVLYSAHWFAMPMEEQVRQIEFLRSHYRVGQLLVDQGGPGWHLARSVSCTPVSAGRGMQETAFRALTDMIEVGGIQFADGPVIDDLCSAVWDDTGQLLIPERPVPGGSGKIHGDALLALLYCVRSMVGASQAGASTGSIQARQTKTSRVLRR